MEFSKNLNLYMNKLGISNYQMSKDTGISDSLIGYWRNGKRKPNFDNLIVISEYLNVSIDFLIRGNDFQDSSIFLGSNFSDTKSELLDTYNNLDKEDIIPKLYERILKQVEHLGITGKQLGELLGLKKSPLTDWKNNKSNPTLEQFTKMCRIFATSSDYLLFGRTENLPTDEQELINTYNQLDRRGQHRVHTIIYEELDRIAANKSSTRKNAV